MKFALLEPELLQFVQLGRYRRDEQPNLNNADGVLFLCPKCYTAKGGPAGTHSVICWFRNRVPADATPGPGRWDVSGSSLETLTLTPSVHLTGAGCGWHGFIRGGETSDA